MPARKYSCYSCKVLRCKLQESHELCEYKLCTKCRKEAVFITCHSCDTIIKTDKCRCFEPYCYDCGKTTCDTCS